MTELYHIMLEHGSPMGSQVLTVPGGAPVRLSPPAGTLAAHISNRGNQPVLYTNCGCLPVRPYGAHELATGKEIEVHGDSMFWSWFIAKVAVQTGYLFVTYYGEKPWAPPNVP